MGQTLYAYANGIDLDEVVSLLETRFDALVAGRTWRLPDVWVVNQRTPEAGTPVTEWDLGLNLTLPAARTRPAGWVEDLVAIATELAALHGETKRTFVIGLHDSKTGATNDLFVVDSDRPDLARLEAAVAAATGKSRATAKSG